jgi:hypothetical protein
MSEPYVNALGEFLPIPNGYRACDRIGWSRSFDHWSTDFPSWTNFARPKPPTYLPAPDFDASRD